jgi:hypothetical protein
MRRTRRKWRGFWALEGKAPWQPPWFISCSCLVEVSLGLPPFCRSSVEPGQSDKSQRGLKGPCRVLSLMQVEHGSLAVAVSRPSHDAIMISRVAKTGPPCGCCIAYCSSTLLDGWYRFPINTHCFLVTMGPPLAKFIAVDCEMVSLRQSDDSMALAR